MSVNEIFGEVPLKSGTILFDRPLPPAERSLADPVNGIARNNHGCDRK